MNTFDTSITLYLNQYAQQSVIFDNAVKILSNNDLFKGTVLAALLWWVWYLPNNKHSNHHREHVVITLFATVIAIAAGRILPLLILPFRDRPLVEESLNFVRPYGVHAGELSQYSSLPSDHAVMFFALCTGLMFVAKKVGLAAFVYASIVIMFPRVYCGFHYTTDILAGAVVGIGIAWFANKFFVENAKIKKLVGYAETKPEYFYPIFFVATLLIATMFYDLRVIIGAFKDLIVKF